MSVKLPFEHIYVTVPRLNEQGKKYYSGEHCIDDLIGKVLPVHSIDAITIGGEDITNIVVDHNESVTVLYPQYFDGDIVVGVDKWA